MKKDLFKPFFLIGSIALSALALPKPPAQERIKEFVRVINVEVIVRVSDHGKPVSGLGKSDFRLTEDGQALEINGFSEFHRALAPAPDSGVNKPAVAAVQETPTPRLLILYFWLFEPGSDYEQALDYFFKTVYRAHDRVLLVSPQRVYEISRPDEIASQRQALAADLAGFIQRVAQYRRRASLAMKSDAERDFRKGHNYTGAATGRQTPLDINTEQFREFASSLKKLDMEKWVLVFCQRDLTKFTDAGYAAIWLEDAFHEQREDGSVPPPTPAPFFNILSIRVPGIGRW